MNHKKILNDLKLGVSYTAQHAAFQVASVTRFPTNETYLESVLYKTNEAANAPAIQLPKD